MPSLQQISTAIFDINNIWWLIIKASIWFIIALMIIVKTDSPNPEKSLKNIKSTLGFFLMFVILSGGVLYVLFNQAPV
jgi:DNA integrity scanning protein DisA with diadenylate cyclase activity